MSAVVKVCEAGSTRLHTRKEIDGRRWISSRQYTRLLDVIFDDQLGSPAAAEAATGIVLGAAYGIPLTAESDANAFCTSITSGRSDDPKLFRVTATYSTEYQDADDPFAQHFTYSTVERQIAFEEDIDGKAVQNSAEDPFDPPPAVGVPDMEIQVQRLNALGSISANTLLGYYNSVNAAEVTWDGETYRPLQLRFRGISIGRAELEGASYLDTTYSFLAANDEDTDHLQDESPHDDYLLDYGYNDLTKKAFIDPETNQRIGRRLDGAGNPAADIDPPNFIHFKKRKRKDFTVFPFV